MLCPAEVILPNEGSVDVDVFHVEEALVSMNTIVTSILQDFRLAHAFELIQQELGWWVLPRSTCWFSRFVFNEFDNNRWIENFCMTKNALISLSHLLCPHIERMNTTIGLPFSPWQGWFVFCLSLSRVQASSLF
jgi:hypothetical protein